MLHISGYFQRRGRQKTRRSLGGYSWWVMGSMSPTRLGPAEDLMLYPSKAPRKPAEERQAPLGVLQA
jgi:hypothetical protein